MKKIANFTQTYQAVDQWSLGSDGKDREFLIDYFIKNKDQIEIRKMFDLHMYTFHNIDVEKSKRIATKIKSVLPHTQFLLYKNMTFSETIKRQLDLLESKGITDLIWIQDDDFFTGKLNDFQKIYNYYKHNEINHLNIGIYCEKNFSKDKKESYNKIEVDDNLFIYKTRACDFQDNNLFGMDNSPFICSIKYLREKIYTNEVFNFNHFNAYDLEGHININGKKNNIERYIVNRVFFEPHNIVGMGGSLGNAKQALENLEKRFGKV
ncbi:MAG: hypothetical protein EBU90_11685 [Proteobacteria bacterium]|nr:hypothetical protein [Pseudomonadota bacterium]NBP14787.1 hypothetical protein [bacterium]